MPQITVKTEWVNKLKAYGAYDRWLSNVKARDYGLSGLNHISTPKTFFDLIGHSFIYFETPEGHEYWSGIANS